MGAAKIRVLVADDDQLFSEALLLTLALHGSYQVVGHARDGREAVELAALRRPDVIVMDVHMPVIDGIEATRLARMVSPGSRVVVLSSSELPEHPARAREAGATDFLRKDATPVELFSALDEAARLRTAAGVGPLQPGPVTVPSLYAA